MAETKNVKKPLVFAVIGVFNTLLDFVLLFLFTSGGIHRVAANTLSSSIAFLFSFFMNRNYTFQSSSKNVVREMVLFILVTLFGLWVLQNLVIWLLTPVISNILTIPVEYSTLVAKLPATAVSMVWNYILYDRIVFQSKTTNSPER